MAYSAYYIAVIFWGIVKPLKFFRLKSDNLLYVWNCIITEIYNWLIWIKCWIIPIFLADERSCNTEQNKSFKSFFHPNPLRCEKAFQKAQIPFTTRNRVCFSYTANVSSACHFYRSAQIRTYLIKYMLLSSIFCTLQKTL